MLTYEFETVDGALYEYLYKCIKEDIISGRLKAGEKLPSKRSFAKNNGVSTITIQNAYDQLISEGYIFTIPKKGYYVSKLEGMQHIHNKETKISLNIHLPEQKKAYLLDFTDHQIDPNNFPFTVWAKLSRETISVKSKELMEISPTGGVKELRTAIAEHLKSFRGMLVDPDQIIVGAGTEYLYGLLVQLLGNDKKYCIENPGYKKLVQIYNQYQIDCRYADLDEYGITQDGLKKADADIAHISPNHHFPTGIIMPASRRYEVLAWANEKQGRYIIEDDYDSEFRMNGKPIPTLFSIDACEKVIYMNTFSKSLTPTIRISYMVLPLHLVNKFYKDLSFYSCTVSNFEQYTLAAFIKRGYLEKHINRMRLYYSRKRSRIIDCIKHSTLNPYCEIIENDSGLHFLIRLKTQHKDSVIMDNLIKKGIRMNPLSKYYFGDFNKEHLYIVDYSNIDLEPLNKACQFIKKEL